MLRQLGKDFLHFFVSLKLTVVLLGLSAILVFLATLDQQNLGIWGIQHKWFRSFVVLHDWHGIPIPWFPGGYFIGGLLFINLIAAHIKRFEFSWKKSGLLITHFGIILLLVGELLTGLWQEEYQLRLDEGETKSYFESVHSNEVAIVDASDPQWDNVVAIPEDLLGKKQTIQHPKLPFRIAVKQYFPNSNLQMRNQAPNAPASEATAGVGAQVAVTPLPITYKQNERNLPSAVIELANEKGPIGSWLVSLGLSDVQSFEYGGKTWHVSMRPERFYTSYSIQLIKFSHDKYPGTEIPKNFSSRVRLKTENGSTDREVLIYMNNPLRFEGLTYYQASFDNNDRTSILQVVKNPSWTLPYIACTLLFLGLVWHFGVSLVNFVSKRARRAQAVTVTT
jgi:hypothetical protein